MLSINLLPWRDMAARQKQITFVVKTALLLSAILALWAYFHIRARNQCLTLTNQNTQMQNQIDILNQSIAERAHAEETRTQNNGLYNLLLSIAKTLPSGGKFIALHIKNSTLQLIGKLQSTKQLKQYQQALRQFGKVHIDNISPNKIDHTLEFTLHVDLFGYDRTARTA